MSFEFYRESNFKETEIGLLPEEWNVLKIFDIVNGTESGDWGLESSTDGFLPCRVIRGTDFSAASKGRTYGIPKRFIKKEKIERLKLFPNDILVELSGGSKDQPTGRVLLVTKKLVDSSELTLTFSNFVKRIKLSHQISPNFFYRYWEFLYQKGRTRIYEKRTTGIRNFKLNDFLQSESIPLPPLSEQKAIAEVLQIIQDAKEKTEEVIRATKELKRSMIKHLFTYGPVALNEVDNVKLKETEIGKIPEHWEVVKLEYVVKIVMGQSPPGKSYNQKGNGKPFLQGKAEFTDLYPKVKNYTTAPIKYAKVGSVLMSVRAPVGDVNIADKEYCIGRGLASISFKENLGDNNFLFYYLGFNKKKIEELGTGSTFKSINKTQIENLLIPLPPLHEQKAIAEILQAIDEKIQREEARKQAIENLFKSMLNELMSGRLRVRKRSGEE